MAIILFFFGLLTQPHFDHYNFGPKQPGYEFELAVDQRIENYGRGSCVHASLEMLLRWQGKDELANYWRQNYEGGEYHDGLIEKLENEHIPYMTTYMEYDVEFIETACASGRGCMVTTTYRNPGDHMIICVHIDENYVYTLDNNDIQVIYSWNRDEFLEIWKNSGSWATTPLFNPPPPKPYS